MAEKSRRRLLAGALILLAAAIFGAGIDWGLPSHKIDSILFGVGENSATQSLHSYTLTGVGITRLAGPTEDDPNLPSDASSHPIGDRSKPITLVENHHGLTEAELRAQGNDAVLEKLATAADAAEKTYADLRVSGDKNADKAKDKALAAQQKVHNYIEDYNRKNFGDLSEATKKDDIARAQILRRFRLYSTQPDEMISFRALAAMHPGSNQFDPKMYQYGGLWIYPLGAIVKAASMVGYVTVSNDPTVYLDSPEMFGRFYILARAYSAVWGIVAVLAVFAIVQRSGVGLLPAFLAAVCFMCMPVVVELSHEVKPHMAGTALILLAILGALKYVETGKWKWVIWTSIACGAATGMVLSGAVSLIILPIMSVLRYKPGQVFVKTAIGILIAAAVYFATNPYVADHLLSDRAVLHNNLANTEAMYPMAPNAVHAAILLLAGMGPAAAVAGVIGVVLWLIAKRTETSRAVGWLIGILAVVVLIEFVLHAGNKPGEYARFAMPADAVLLLAAFIGIPLAVRSTAVRAIIGILVIAFTILHSVAYERGFIVDDSRTRAAADIDVRLAKAGDSPVLYITAEPAPYCLPPVNLFHWKIVLLPPDGKIPAGAAPGVLVKPDTEIRLMDAQATPISWANVTFDVADVGGK